MKIFREKKRLANPEEQRISYMLDKLKHEHGHISLDSFRNVVKCKNVKFATLVFNTLNPDASGKISLMAYINKVSELLIQPPEEKLRFIFKIYDTDGNGTIEKEELQEVLHACAAENDLELSMKTMEDLTEMLMNDIDSDKSGDITYNEFIDNMGKYPRLIDSLATSLDNWLLPPIPQKRSIFMSNFKEKLSISYMKNNIQSVGFLFVFLIVNLILMAVSIYKYKDHNVFVIVARICGLCLNFTAALALLLMSRHTITWLRSKGLTSILPLDEYIYYHKLVGCFIFFYSVLHTIMHLCNFATLASTVQVSNTKEAYPQNQQYSNATNATATLYPQNQQYSNETNVIVLNTTEFLNVTIPIHQYNIDPTIKTFTYLEYLFSTKPGIGWVYGSATITGWGLITILLIMMVAAHPFIRKSKMFEVFFFTHLLFIPFYILLILHGPVFWQWIIVPAVFYALEMFIRAYHTFNRKGKTFVSQAALLPGKVTHLIIKKPTKFYYSPGDYIFLNIPSIAKYEWHPFTLSSAPEMNGYLSVHINAVGQWTNRLYQFFDSITKMKKSIKNKKIGLTKSLRRNRAVEACDEIDLTDHRSVSLHGKKYISLSKDPETQIDLEESSDKEINDKDQPAILNVDDEKSEFYVFSKKFSIPKSKVIFLPDSSNQGKGKGGIKSIVQTLFNEQNVQNTTAFKAKMPMPVFIVGPYGSPSSQIFRAEHAVLVGTGIGITPFASILQSIVHKYSEANVTCPKCNNQWIDQQPKSIMNLKKVDFFWINRSHKSFEWFVSLLRNLEEEHNCIKGSCSKEFLNMNMYLTSALKKENVQATFLQIALDLMHRSSNKDVLTGLQTKATPGRPNWNKVFEEINKRKCGKITVFFCGSPQLGKILRTKCSEFGFKFCKEKF